MRNDSRSHGSSPESVEQWIQNMEDSEQLPETQLPAYSPTVHSSSSMDPNQGMCCAFRKIAGYARRTESYLELMNQPPKYRFLCFVALCQIPDKSLGSEARYRCPVLGCGLQFDREHSVELLNHVSGCSRLALGRYYCPYCYRPEVFADPETFPHGLKHSRRHFLKNAFDAIFRLGSKKLRKPVHHSRKVDSFKEARSSKKRRYVEEPHIPELEGGEFVPASGRVELEESRGNQSLSVKRSSYHSAGAVELSGSPFWPSELDAGFPEVAPSATVEPSAVELSSNRYSYPSVTQTSTGGEATPDYSLSPVSPATSSERWFSSKDFDSPISPIGINSSAPWSIDSVERIIQSTPRLHAPSPTPSYQFDTTQGPHSATNGMEGWQPQIRPDIRIDTKCASSRPVQTSSPASSGVGIPIRQPIEHRSPLKKVPSPLQIEAEERSPTKLVGEIRGLFNSLFKVSVHKMSQPPISPAAVALFDQFPSAAGLFSEAFFGLDKVVRGILPTTLFEVLGLAHLVYASAFACQQEDVEDLLPEIFKDLKNWSQAIIKDDDRKIYLQLVQQIFSIDGEENSSPYGDPQWTYKGRYSGASHSPLGMPPPPPPPSFWPMDTGSGEQLAALQREFMDEDKLLGSFQKGVAIRLCLEYLSTFEYMSMEKNETVQYPAFFGFAPSPPISPADAKNGHNIRKEVIDQLLAVRSTKEYRPVVDNAAMLLATSPNTSLRELELYLTQEGKGYTISQRNYKRFADTVAQLCERAARTVPWEKGNRYSYYISDIQVILDIHYGLLMQEHGHSNYDTEPMPTPDLTVPQHPPSAESDTSFRPFSWQLPPSSTSDSPCSEAKLSYNTSTETIPTPPNPVPTFPKSEPLPTRVSAPPGTLSVPPSRSFSSCPPPRPTSQPSLTSGITESSLTCKICGKVLSGKLVYLPSNMKRHMRELHSPAAKRLLCTWPSCDRAFIRNHNLTHHVKTVHGSKNGSGGG